MINLLTGISNAEYHCGKAEDVIVKTTTMLDEEESQVIAILDPPRPGCRTYTFLSSYILKAQFEPGA